MRPILLTLVAVLASACGASSREEPVQGPSAPVGEARAVAAPAGLDVPEALVYVPGGAVTVGVLPREGGVPTERPAFDADVAPFLLDRSPVTVARFRAFVEATGHTTQAETFGDGAVMDTRTGAWELVEGADWHTPFGPDAPAAPDNHPVTQVAWTDAEAFCAWDGEGRPGRLPTEVEWEHAARGGVNDRSPYAWGDALEDGGAPHANTWTGTFPSGTFPGHDDGADGYRSTTSPVGQFGRTPLGLTDMGGDVWEWTASWYRSYPLAAGDASAPPAGPTGEPERTQRGGSFLCNPSYCHGFRVSARSHATPESSFAHVGFRCARNLQEAPVDRAARSGRQGLDQRLASASWTSAAH